jgi:hypothetical protein
VSGLVAAALFATGPWAVVYSRKIWAQDFVPVLATGAMWAAHSLVLGKNPKAMFWLLCLPLSVIQIHFSGFALTASCRADCRAAAPQGSIGDLPPAASLWRCCWRCPM